MSAECIGNLAIECSIVTHLNGCVFNAFESLDSTLASLAHRLRSANEVARVFMHRCGVVMLACPASNCSGTASFLLLSSCGHP
jgi:hypothetical protein